jgi:hypothetical protein
LGTAALRSRAFSSVRAFFASWKLDGEEAKADNARETGCQIESGPAQDNFENEIHSLKA